MSPMCAESDGIHPGDGRNGGYGAGMVRVWGANLFSRPFIFILRL